MYSFVLAWVRTLVILQTKLIDLIWTRIDWSIIISIILLLGCAVTCTCFLWTERLYKLLKPPFKNWVTILVGLRNKDPPRFCPGGGGGTPLYKLYRYVPPHRVGFLRRFNLDWKRAYILPILVWNRYGFRGNYGSVWTYLSWKMSKLKERRKKYANLKRIWRIFYLRPAK